jgi:hypothetical protein
MEGDVGDLSKGILMLLIAGVVGSQAFKALDSGDLSSPTVASSPKSADEKAIKSIMAGADPSDVLAATAAGKRPTHECDAGYIIGDLDDNPFSEISYASVNAEGITYIQVSRYNPSYLIQKQYQVVSATEIDEIPDSIKERLQQTIANPVRCNSMDLYLSNIKHTQ